MKNLLLLSIVLFSFSISHAQLGRFINSNPYWEGEIIMTDGTKLSGEIQVPHKVGINKVKIKKCKSCKTEKLTASDIKILTVYSPKENNEYSFHYTKVYLSKRQKKARYAGLYMVYGANNYATIYKASQTYKVKKKGEHIILSYVAAPGDFPSVDHYIKKRDSDKTELLASTNLVNGRRNMMRLLEDAPVIWKRIESNELGINHADLISREYLKETYDY